MAIVSTFLIVLMAVALIAGMVGCAQPAEYSRPEYAPTIVAAGQGHTVGLKSDGTVVAVGWQTYGQCDVGAWTDITQVTAGELYTVGLKSDGTVVAAGRNWEGQCNVGGWKNITQVTAGGIHTAGVKSDGTVVAAGQWVDVPKWNLLLT